MAKDKVTITCMGFKVKLEGLPANLAAAAAGAAAGFYLAYNYETFLPKLVEVITATRGTFVNSIGEGSLVFTLIAENKEAKNQFLMRISSGELLNALNEQVEIQGKKQQGYFKSTEIMELHTLNTTSENLNRLKVKAQEALQEAYKIVIKQTKENDEEELEWNSIKQEFSYKSPETRTTGFTEYKTNKPQEEDISQNTDLSSKKRKHSTGSVQEKENAKASFSKDIKVPLEDVFSATDPFCQSERTLSEEYESMNKFYNLSPTLKEASFYLKYYSVLVQLRRFPEAEKVCAELTEIVESLQATPQGFLALAGELNDNNRPVEAIFFCILAADRYMSSKINKIETIILIACIKGLVNAADLLSDAEPKQERYIIDRVLPQIKKCHDQISQFSTDKGTKDEFLAISNNFLGQFTWRHCNNRDTARSYLEKARPFLENSDRLEEYGDCLAAIASIHDDESNYAKAKECIEKAKKSYEAEQTNSDEDLSEKIEDCTLMIKRFEKCLLETTSTTGVIKEEN